ncbi:MAG: hypothetical protein AAF211_00840 [Myxococcota bacterium]
MSGVVALLSLVACPSEPPPSPPPPPDPTVDSGFVAPPFVGEVRVTVRLDGEPVEGAWVGVGGGVSTITDPFGEAELVVGEDALIIASHPEARTRGTEPDSADVVLDLTRFATVDNEAYVFGDPGEPGDRGTTAQCAHCHQSALTDWDASTHRRTASNPRVHDVYAGTAVAATQAACDLLGGVWTDGTAPGTGETVDRCYVGGGTLPDLNDCLDDGVACEATATAYGACADCHAPGIDGTLGGRDLLEARGRSHDKGVHCDVCHKVESVDLGAPPGVGGALGILRPSEPGATSEGGILPLFFGPYPDVPNPRMGAVARSLYREAELCGACHQLDQAVLVPGQSADPDRWPDGRLPVHSTYAEWQDGPYAPYSPCQSCHMPPETRYLTAVDWAPGGLELGIANGWPRPPGAIRRHRFDGPRADDPELLRLALALEATVDRDAEGLLVRVTTSNVGAGHAVPTGEPLRSVLLTVEATCEGAPLRPRGGDVVPAFGGALAEQDATGNWTTWPGATVGQRVRVVERTGWRDYEGPGPFGDGHFDVADKGLPLESWVDEAAIVAVDGDTVTLDHALAPGHTAYLIDDGGFAGAPGFGFARVLTDAAGARQVPHHRAVDVVSDNRLLPLRSVQTTHRFVDCADPDVTVRLLHRGYPLGEALRRGWPLRDILMAEVTP